MYGKILSADVRGIEGYKVTVEADVSDGMPMVLMVGYLASEVREASDRVRTALRNCGVYLPAKRITINLAPAGVRKSGSKFDLPIAAALLMALGYAKKRERDDFLVVGELSLNGEIHSVPGVLPMVEAAKEMGCSYCIVPMENVREASVIAGIGIVGISHLRELMELLLLEDGVERWSKKTENLLVRKAEEQYEVDFSDIHGQESVKRAAQVAVAGMHNFAMIGPPGSGKSMLARRIPTILPPLSLEESLEISKIYSIAGLLSEEDGLMNRRPFRAPHHTVTATALTGGGRVPMPGEISLATNGVLFLDELPEFQKRVLEVLRQPMEEGEIRISRNFGTYVYPARFMLVAAMNPCKCGFYPDVSRCTCGPGEVHRYLGRISRPLLDRIDIYMEVPEMPYEALHGKGNGETSAEIRERMKRIHQIQQERYRGTGYRFNADLNGAGLERYCPLGDAEQELMQAMYRKMRLSARGYHRLLKVARTIADLEEAKNISCDHLLEAICYKGMERLHGGQ